MTTFNPAACRSCVHLQQFDKCDAFNQIPFAIIGMGDAHFTLRGDEDKPVTYTRDNQKEDEFREWMKFRAAMAHIR